MPEMVSPIIMKAMDFAAKVHRTQPRKGSRMPYLIHPLGVAKILIDNNEPDEVVAAGILHDVIEDCREDHLVTIPDIRKEFGDYVGDLVEHATEPNHDTDSWESRKHHTIEYLKGLKDLSAVSLICADKLDNLLSIQEDLKRHGESVWTRFSRPKKDQIWYYTALAEVFAERADEAPDKSLFREFSETVRTVFG